MLKRNKGKDGDVYEDLVWRATYGLEGVIKDANKIKAVVEEIIFFPERKGVSEGLYFDEISEAVYNLEKLHAKLSRLFVRVCRQNDKSNNNQ